MLLYELFDAFTRPSGVANFGGVLRRTRPSHWFDFLGSGLGLVNLLTHTINYTQKKHTQPHQSSINLWLVA
jgi:hypothetical protein